MSPADGVPNLGPEAGFSFMFRYMDRLPLRAGNFGASTQTVRVVCHVIFGGNWNDTTGGYVSQSTVNKTIAVVNKCAHVRVPGHLCICALCLMFSSNLLF
jgi:hypothetical protein